MSIDQLEQRCAKLRQKLKEWETSFAASNNGRKPSREDVKQCTKIAQRYKEYNKIRETLVQRVNVSAATPSKRKCSETTQETPSKKSKSLPQSHPAIVDPYDPPVSFLLSPSQQLSCVGPTPQKNGKILGIFDAFSSTRSKVRTPNRRRALEDRETNVEMTPSRQRSSAKSGDRDKLRRTQSLGTLDVKTTPTLQRVAKSCTPESRGSIRKLRLDDTPSFLRRDSQNVNARSTDGPQDHQESWSPFASRMRRSQSLGRSLSTMVKDLRDMEDEYLDEEFELMREMENEEPVKRPAPGPPRLLVEDSQMAEMPLGPDRGLESDTEHEDDSDTEGKLGKPAKTWKKKGQKRTTRRVNMKPNTAKWQPEPRWKNDDEDAATEERPATNDLQGDPSTTGQENVEKADDRNPGDAANDDNEDIWMSDEAKAGKVKRGRPKKSTDQKQAPSRPKKKVNALAHTNFRALKIRNKNSKGSRFRRRRG